MKRRIVAVGACVVVAGALRAFERSGSRSDTYKPTVTVNAAPTVPNQQIEAKNANLVAPEAANASAVGGGP